MNCDKCAATIVAGDERIHQNQTFCEDCYMVALSPIKTCDPWAVHSAKNFERLAGDKKQLTPLQAEILEKLKVHGAMEPVTLLAKLGVNMQLADLQRDFSILRHMEKVGAEKQGDTILWRLWA
jgi:hypothetical protein